MEIIHNSLKPALFMEPTDVHGFTVTVDDLFVSLIHWLTFFSNMLRGRAPSLRTMEWKSLISNLEPATKRHCNYKSKKVKKKHKMIIFLFLSILVKIFYFAQMLWKSLVSNYQERPMCNYHVYNARIIRTFVCHYSNVLSFDSHFAFDLLKR